MISESGQSMQTLSATMTFLRDLMGRQAIAVMISSFNRSACNAE